MSVFRIYRACTFAVMVSVSTVTTAQDVAAVPAAPVTLWRFIGIPQGIQKVRDVTTNRRGRFPGLERKPALTRIGDPANLASPNPAIKAAAEIKTAEDMKQQKIKAIKYLATIGCGCYDKDGKITDAILAATDDCTPDVRMAAIEAIEAAASGECCRKCGSTSCCNEKVNKRLSEIAYERGDDGCPLEPNAEIRQAAKRVLCKCCPGGPPSGPIEEEFETDSTDDEPGDQNASEPEISGESADDAIEGESSGDNSGQEDAPESDADSNSDIKLNLPEPAAQEALHSELNPLLLIGGRPVKPVVIDAVSFMDSIHSDSDSSALQQPLLPPAIETDWSSIDQPVRRTEPTNYQVVQGQIGGIDFATGEVLLRTDDIQHVNPRGSVNVYHRYLTGERQVARLSIKQIGSELVKAKIVDPVMIGNIHVGDRIVIR